MKKLLFKNVFIIAILSLFATVIFSCDKEDPEYKVVVTVKYLDDSLVYVPNARVVINMNAVADSGWTDEGGQFMAKFDNEAILNIKATIDTGTPPTIYSLSGNSMVRLKKDETVYRTVFLSL